MKTYAFYPGCSCETMATSYRFSTEATAERLGVGLKEIEDWNCCGATAYSHIDEILATTLCARNLAMAEKEGLDVVAVCSACYKNLHGARSQLRRDEALAEHVNFALEEDDLSFQGTSRVRHIVDVFVNDVGLDAIRERVARPLNGLRVAPYYGCQLLRPAKDGQALKEIENPRYLESLLSAIGAEPIEWPFRLRCCGASLIVTNRRAALAMVHDLLRTARDRGAEVIATVCPLCQVNLECYQRQVGKEFGAEIDLPVMYLTQLLGLALGLDEERLGIGPEFVSTKEVVARARGAATT